MNFYTVAVVIFIVALIGVFATALIFYLSSLVKSAYHIKIEMRNTLEDGLKRVDEELNKRSRSIKREILEDVEKTKANMVADYQRRDTEVGEEARKNLTAVEEALRQALAEHAKTMKELLDQAYALEHRIKELRKIQAAPPAVQPSIPPLDDEPPKASGPPNFLFSNDD
jgi:hypothetical protein